MVSTLKVNKIQIPNSDSDVISLDASTGNITIPKPITLSSTLSGSGYDLLASVYSTDTVASVDIDLPSGYTSYYLNLYINGDSTSNSENLDLTYKIDGSSSFLSSSFGTQNVLVDNGTSRNENGCNSTMELMTTNGPNDGWSSNVWLNGFGSTVMSSLMNHITSKGKGGTPSTFVGGGGHTDVTTCMARATAIRLSFTNGNIVEIHYRLFGIA